jgi:tRNA A-37 threonylcarbamoyl transferase component Bud32
MAGRTVYASSPDWAVVGKQLDELLCGSEFRILKKTSRTLAGVAQFNGDEIFIKRVISSSWLKGIIARVCGSRARKTLRGATILHRAGFSYPRLFAAFEYHHGGSVRTSYIIVEYLRRAKVLSRFALADGRDFRWRRWLSQRLAQTIRSLHDAGCYTRDLQETNLMLEAQGSGLRIYFTDLEDFRWLPLVPQRLRLLNLVHLDRSIGRFVSRAHRLRFFYNYLGGKPQRTEARALLARVYAIRQRIERRNRRRQRSTAILMPALHRSRSE